MSWGQKFTEKNSIIMMFMNWRNGSLIALGVLVAGLLIGWQLSPRVSEVSPGGEENIHGRQPLTIQFNRAMDPESVEGAFEILPPIEGKISWDAEGKLLSFTPRNIWPAGETVAIRLRRGLQSKLKLPGWQEFIFEWMVRPTSLVYLWPADGKSNLYQVNPENGESQALTDHPGGVLDYSIAPNKAQIYYSFIDDTGLSKIMIFDLLTRKASSVIDCEDALCTNPQLAPSGDHLAYEVISPESGILPGVQIYNLNDQSKEDLGTKNEYLENPLWSPAGWLSYYNRTSKGYQFWIPGTETSRFFPNETGGFGTWSADGRYFLTSEILFVGETLAPRHLQLYDLVEGTIQDLSEGDFLEDLNPSFSTRGLRFAFSRKSLSPQDWTPGRQLWVMDLDSGESYPLTDEVDYQHTSYAWHPDGAQLAYVRYNQAVLSELPEIWLGNTSSGEALRLIINGFAPGWIP